jgi:hypothetical protein
MHSTQGALRLSPGTSSSYSGSESSISLSLLIFQNIYGKKKS